MSENKTTVVGLYDDLDYRKSHDFAEDAVQAREMILEKNEGYQVVGVITADTTMEDIEEMKDRAANTIADMVMPPKDSPIWEMLAKHFYDRADWRGKAVYAGIGEADYAAFEAEYDAVVAAGGDAESLAKEYVYSHGGLLF